MDFGTGDTVVQFSMTRATVLPAATSIAPVWKRCAVTTITNTEGTSPTDSQFLSKPVVALRGRYLLPEFEPILVRQAVIAKGTEDMRNSEKLGCLHA